MPGFNYGGKGDGTNWSSERGTGPEPGGGSRGNGGDRDNSRGGAGNRGNWAGSGPLSAALINDSIAEALEKQLPRNTVEATSTPAYKKMRAAFDALPLDKQPEARAQITKAWQSAHDAMPDRTTTTENVGGGKNGHNVTRSTPNWLKEKMKGLNQQVNNDLSGALAQHQKAEADARAKAEAVAKAKAEAEAKAKAEAAAKAKAEAEAKAKAEAAAKAKAEAEAKAKAEAAAKAKAEAEAKAKAEAEAKAKAEAEAKAKAEADAVKDAVKFTADFYKEVFSVYGEKAEQLANLLATQAKGKNIRNIDDALKAYEKHKTNINKKINAQDRAAIAKALESVDVKEAAKNFAKFSKGLGYVGPTMDVVDLVLELRKAIKEDNWRSFFVKIEAIAISFGATQLAALAFASLLGAPVGLLGYALIMAGIGALVSDDVVDAANKIIGI
ncbi:colicin-like pore-forming protein [Klebsiella variicola]|uniref:colicin-like pore-forming protein n=1 Tax=Klebsiella variicola TaxID=244366 RepID=UPI001D1177C8|nr:colicin-like pore-forming protein [Klebsiella variicola]MCJ5187864.1 colicin-like pore-forming protein [Klebsiella variicola]